MKNDSSRNTFDARNHFSSVRMQQGRVQLDADWNEQSEIVNHRVETEASDIIGLCGGPLHDAAFRIFADGGGPTKEAAKFPEDKALLQDLQPHDFFVGAGRYYVDGILCENEQLTSYATQPDLPDTMPIQDAGWYLIYVDVWQRHLTALDVPSIREIALGGPDTATRTKTVWQVKCLPVGEQIKDGCVETFTDFENLIAPSDGKLSARTKREKTSLAPCIVPSGAGYSGLENQLYRVEIHRGGGNDLEYKWSRDNGVVVTTIENIDGQKITVHDLGPDDVLGFKENQWVELIDDGLELNGLPGQLAQISQIDPAINLITLKSTVTPLAAHPGGIDKARHPKLRRWDGIGAVKFHANASEEPYLDLESGVQVRFSQGTFRTGDYWTIPARTATADTQSGNIEWPQDASNTPLALTPFGIRHHYCRLAMLHWTGESFDVVEDCRHLFPPLTELTSLFYISGDGQEAMPTNPLPKPLQVGVFNGSWPIAGARVQFTTHDGGILAPNLAELASGTNTLAITTGTDGIASCVWRLSDVGNPSQQVEASLLNAPQLDANPDAHPPVIRFNGNLSIADQVSYDPGHCATLQGRKTVQQALRVLTQLTSLYKISGDGQEIIRGEALKQPLKVIVANSCGPITNQKVTFTIVSPGAGTLSAGNSGEVNRIGILTDDKGIATCHWKPDDSTPVQEVEVTIGGEDSPPTAPPTLVRFNAMLSLASHVYYDPATCPKLAAAGVNTVQGAIDNLCNIKAQTGGGCEVVVGKGGQFETLDEAINKLLEGESRDICICLLPGNYELPGGLVIAENPDQKTVTHMKIQGCGLGSRIIMNDGVWRIGPLASFTLREVAVSAGKNLRPIQFTGCQEILIEGCYFYTSQSGGPADIITVSGASFVRIENNYFSSLWYSAVQLNTIDSLKLPAPVPFTPQNFDSLVVDAWSQLTNANDEIRKQVVDKYNKFLRTQADISTGLRKSIDAALKVIAPSGRQPPVAGGKSLIGEVDAVSVLMTGNALVFLDEEADTLIENNRFYGGIALYGNEGRFSDVEWKSFARSIGTGDVELLSPAPGAMKIRGNVLTGIYVDRSIVNKIHALSPPDQLKQLNGLFRGFLCADNFCQVSSNQLLSYHLSLSSTQFNFGNESNFDAATVAGRSAIIIGNSALNSASPLFFGVPTARNEGNPLSSMQAVANLLGIRPL